MWLIDFDPESCDHLVFTPNAIVQIIKEKHSTLIQSINVESGALSVIFQTKEQTKDCFTVSHDEDWIVLTWKSDAESRVLVLNLKSESHKFLSTNLYDLDELQDLAVKSGKILAYVRDGWAFIWEASTGHLIEKIPTKRATNQLCNRIVKFDPNRSEFTLSLVGLRANLITYKGMTDLKNFKVMSKKSTSYNDMPTAKMADHGHLVVHDLVRD